MRAKKPEKGMQKFHNQLVRAFIVSLLIVVLLIIIIHYFRWPWLLNHPHGLSLEVGFSILISCVIFSITISQRRKWFLIGTVFPLTLILIPLLGRYDNPPDIEDVIKILKNETDLQKFREKYNGTKVVWSGYVDSVGEPNGKGIPLKFRPESQKEASYADLVTSRLPQSAKVDLVDSDKNDWIKVEGMLHIDDTGNVSLDDSIVIYWHHMPKNKEKPDTNDDG